MSNRVDQLMSILRMLGGLCKPRNIGFALLIVGGLLCIGSLVLYLLNESSDFDGVVYYADGTAYYGQAAWYRWVTPLFMAGAVTGVLGAVTTYIVSEYQARRPGRRDS